MARVIGQTKSWVWWLAGALCALVFGAAARSEEGPGMSGKYGVQARPVRPPIDNPAVTDEQKQKAEKLVAEYLAPPAAAEPTAEQKATVEKLVKEFGSADFQTREAASTQAGKLGPAVLGLLREAAKAKDPEVATRAGTAVAAIENAARQGTVEELKKIQPAAQTVIQQQMTDARQAEVKTREAIRKAEAEGNQAEAEKLRAEAKAAGERRGRLSGLMAMVSPLRMGPGGPGAVAVYGIRAPQPVE
jgi:hypothetical protein